MAFLIASFECLIVEASSQAQNHLGVLADR
jgi:hypothetical protein